MSKFIETAIDFAAWLIILGGGLVAYAIVA